MRNNTSDLQDSANDSREIVYIVYFMKGVRFAMGFYQSSGERKRRIPGWIGVSVVSALVGCGATLALYPVLQNHQVAGTPATTTTGVTSTNLSAPVTNVNVSVNDAITQVVKQAVPSVVAVVNYQSTSDFFNQQSQLEQSGVGTGVLFAKDNNYGYVVTNNHVVEGAQKLELVLSSGKHIQADVVGTDPYTDLAVLRTPVNNVANLPTAVFGNSDDIQVGEPVVAIGTPMGLDFQDSVTSGIISAKQRVMPVEEPETQQVLDYETVVQTDAAINPGNSGGPLLNMKGQVIAINSSKIVDTSVQGMGFGIPSNTVRTIVQEIMQTGHATHPSLGVEGYSLSTLPDYMRPDVPVTDGVYVQSVTSPNAQAAGLKPQDVIVAVNGKTVTSIADLRTDLFQLSVGQKVSLRVYRGQQELTLTETIGAMSTQTSSDGPSAQDQSSDGQDIQGQ
jgi:serine protease Do